MADSLCNECGCVSTSDRISHRLDCSKAPRTHSRVNYAALQSQEARAEQQMAAAGQAIANRHLGALQSAQNQRWQAADYNQPSRKCCGMPEGTPHHSSCKKVDPYKDFDQRHHEQVVAENMSLKRENAELLQENAKLRRQLERTKR